MEIKKDWAEKPIEVYKGYRIVYGAMSLRRNPVHRETMREAISEVGLCTLISVWQIETRVKDLRYTGIYSRHYIPQLDKEDEDLTRNLKYFADFNASEKEL